MMKRTLAALVAALAASSAVTWAGQRIEQRRPAAPDGVVEIENAAGSIRVTGWDRHEVEVTGTLGSGAEGLGFDGAGRHTRIEVETRGNPHRVHADLEIRVPRGSRLEITSFNARIAVSDVDGTVKAENVNGSISVAGGSSEVDAETVNGGVEVSCRCTRAHAESVNGPVTVRGASGEVTASTVNGALVVEGAAFDNARLETVNGRIRFEGDLRPKATLDIESVGGSVELVLPAAASADFSLSTFSGDIENSLSAEAPRRTSRYTSEKELTFSVGAGGASVSVHTLSGDIVLTRRR